MDGQCSTPPPAPPADGQNGGILDPSMSNDYINRLKLLQMQETGDLHQQTHDDVELFQNPGMNEPVGISLLMNRAQTRQQDLARQKTEETEAASESINDTIV